ncbi:hypothetical protein GBAR_LOCUS5997 [Geodia barretti]|uniref:Pyrrolo-quinoline quinone repeat domain-containing protein n=1 Tax=Geodia barretti TaxID=519541 RepID=A0AA35RD80_GEOBA|nr:hypothetical protein GBAR_LOCUS5997 [Geodia barretti]
MHPSRSAFVSSIACAALLTLGARTVPAQQGAPADGEWRTFGGDLGSTKYSPLDQITRDNFEQLELQWRWRTPDALLSKTTPRRGRVARADRRDRRRT